MEINNHISFTFHTQIHLSNRFLVNLNVFSNRVKSSLQTTDLENLHTYHYAKFTSLYSFSLQNIRTLI